MRMFIPRNEIADAIRTRTRVFWSIGIFTAFINLLMLVPSVYMLQVYDRVLPSRNEITLLMLTLIMLGMFAMMSLLEYIRSMVVICISNQLDMRLNTRVYTAVYEANIKNGSSDAGQMLNDLTNLRQFLTGSALFTFFDVPWFPVYLSVIFLFNPWLGLFALLGALLLISLAVINEFVSKKPLAEASKLSIVSGNLASTNLRNAEVIEALGMLPNLRHRWFDLHQQFLSSQRIASERSGRVSAVTKFVRMSLQSLVLGLGGWLAIDGHITPGMMIAGSILMGRTLAPIEQVINVWKSYSAARLSYDRLVRLLETYPQRSTGMSLPRPEGVVSVEGVSATPPGSSEAVVLHNVSFGIQPGDVLGIIGPSASGKSTLARVLVGVWPVSEGTVRLDNSDIYQWDKSELGPYIGYLPQDIELFAGTIAENIARFNDIDSEKVIEAAKLAGVHELILRFPDGYNTVLGSSGVGLSGGQKQRIGLARALYGIPSLVVLDEPDSSLDDAGKKALDQAITSLRRRNKTVILITHRTSLLSMTSKLLLLVNGNVNAFGPTQQVLQRLKDAQKMSKFQQPVTPIVARDRKTD
ncbi:type I secretion system permease/ATPase [Salmonella enterica]|uniref:Type I secretion system permease/ATPase n=6 Tax=Salmonella enterica TaxID=28901 RepID=A0A3Z3F8M3_SALDZ|nr:type I secretion system permease/ATPase [Salmonella enterica]AXC69078.1 type I secretion system permease/ATPase [Salmonella enterica subsp. diarizonae serovar 59:z10:-]EAB9742101.1 type I secretion system permease/ATPase [Salmonella enterica subsp. diarizonae]EBH8951520.1 type I secretion system permease/ATPase [Salmonella enterica subsp. diarizonae serovar 48:i:z]EBV2375130.1 type I secretion system permease/ATPase [Salmonella enterica subsp. enterica serovar Enteritidis]ECG1721370.1 type 